MSFTPDGYPEVLADLAELLALVLGRELPQNTAENLALQYTERLRLTWGGQEVYIPRGVIYETLCRDRELYNQFRGNNYPELMDRFGLGLQQVYECIARERARRARQHPTI